MKFEIARGGRTMSQWFPCPRRKNRQSKTTLEICQKKGLCENPREWVYDDGDGLCCHWKNKERGGKNELLRRSA